MINFFQNLFNSNQINLDPLNFLGILIAAAISIYPLKANIPFSCLQERHEKLIFPLFDLLEPILYKKINDPSIWDKIFNLIDQNKSLVDGELLSIYYYCKQNQSHENFILLCTYVDRAYDKSSRALKLKRRPVQYRIHRKQYKNKNYFFLYLISLCLMFAVHLVFGIAILFTISSLMYAIFVSTNNMGQLILLLLYCAIILFFLKFWEKNF